MNTQDCIEKGLDEAIKYNEEVGNTMTSDQEYWFMMGNVKAVDKMVDKACEWLKINYGHFDGSIEDLVADFRKAMEQ